MLLSEKHFQILETLGGQEISTQRQLAQFTGISLGQINYVLKQFLSKGLVKIGNFRKNPHKIGYAYLLTPKGIEAKSKLAARFIISKLKEYNNIRSRLARKLTAIQKSGYNRIVFIGPEIVKEFIDCIIHEKALALILVAHCKDWQDIKQYDDNSFDLVVEFNTDQDTKAKKLIKISSDRIISLW
ncbi:MAG: MarR family EPS-associated transcriptional regulator [Desulfobacteraceae bacterium]|uniref:MarR family EPS-associated transcriptional regulator n=1 Tax=Candidatus Desulfaltia bathyphila TaxID=2841697 RepID=A0A8J6T947_9BACT|nr:MarR family EPS-associated transcriptional regulator [Candidatus Desulfaltia bathyphila]